jgi:hypothetical protein
MRWLALVFAALVMAAGHAHAQSQATVVSSCGAAGPVSGWPLGSVQPVSQTASGLLCTNAGGSSGSSFGSPFPSTGTAIGFKNGAGNFDFGLVDASHFLDVNCQVGCAGGSASNASSGVATSSTNGQTLAWLYGFNGTTWDRLLSTSGALNVVPGSAGFGITNLPATLAATGTSLNVNVTGGVTTGSSFGSAFPATGTAVGFKNAGGNLDWGLVDASHFLDVNCQVGCSGGSASNASSGVATSSTNGQSVSWLYGFNGTTWDQLRSSSGVLNVVPGSAGFGITNLPPTLAATGTSLNVNVTGGVTPGATFSSAFPSTGTAVGFKNASGNLDWGLVDASHFLDVNCQVGCSGGSASNATSGVATSSTNGQTIAWMYGFNGTTWDQLQVDASKFLNVNAQANNLTKIAGNSVATAASGIQKVGLTDGSGNAINSTSNALNENCSNCLVTPTDEGAFTAGTSGFLNVGGFFQTTATSNALTNGQFGTFQTTAQRALFTNLRNSSGTEIGTSANPVNVTSTSTPTPQCSSVIAINQTTSTDVKTLTNNGYICSVVLVSATAQNVSIVQGTGSVCATSGVALMGGTTASMAFAANGGISSVAGTPWLKTTTTAQHLCVLQSSTGNVSGVITYQDAS